MFKGRSRRSFRKSFKRRSRKGRAKPQYVNVSRGGIRL